MKLDISTGMIQDILNIYDERIQTLTSQLEPLRREKENLVEEVKILKDDNFKFIKGAKEKEELEKDFNRVTRDNRKLEEIIERMKKDLEVKIKEILRLRAELEEVKAKYDVSSAVNRELMQKEDK